MCNKVSALSLSKKIFVFELASMDNDFLFLSQKSKIKKKTSKTEWNASNTCVRES